MAVKPVYGMGLDKLYYLLMACTRGLLSLPFRLQFATFYHYLHAIGSKQTRVHALCALPLRHYGTFATVPTNNSAVFKSRGVVYHQSARYISCCWCNSVMAAAVLQCAQSARSRSHKGICILIEVNYLLRGARPRGSTID